LNQRSDSAVTPADSLGIVEWVALTPRTIVVATQTRAWLHNPGVFGHQVPFAGVMQGPA